jgi:hypothetical protein
MISVFVISKKVNKVFWNWVNIRWRV